MPFTVDPQRSAPERPTLARRPLVALLAGATLLGVGPVASSAGNYKLSGFLTGLPQGQVWDEFVGSPDGSLVVYAAGTSPTFARELFSVPADDSATPTRLSGALPPGGEVSLGFAIDPSSSRAVYVADQDTDDVFELYSVAVDGSAPPTKLHEALPQSADVIDFRISPDGARVAYVADQDNDGVFELYSAPIGGGKTPVKLNSSPVNGGDVETTFTFSADSSRVVYRADQDTDDVFELYSAPTDGSQTAVKLNGALTNGNVSTAFVISPDSARVLYIAREDSNQRELFSIPIDAGQAAVKLNTPLVLGGLVRQALVTPDSSWVVYAADQETVDVVELWGVPIAGGTTPVRINDPLVAGGNVDTPYAITPDSARVVYRADEETDSVQELFSAPVGGGGSTKINGALVTGGDVGPSFPGNGEVFQLSPDGSRVVYFADQDTNQITEIYSTPVDGSQAAVKLNGPLVPGAGLIDFRISDDSARVAYLADQAALFDQELYTVPIDGSGSAARLNGPLVNEGDVESFLVMPGSARAIYLADQHADGAYELYSAPLDASDGAGRLNTRVPFVHLGDVTSFEVSSSGEWVVYNADQDVDHRIELYSVPVDGSADPIKLNLPIQSGGDVDDYAISPDGTRVVYQAPQQFVTDYELYSVPIDGSQPATKLNPPLGQFENVSEFVITPDSSRVVFLGDLDTVSVLDLYSVPIEGGAAVRLSGPFVPGGGIHIFSSFRFELAPDGQRVIYRADGDTDDVLELYSAPVDGSEAAIKLNGSPVPGGYVLAFEISPDSASVVYLADQDVDGTNEIFAAPIDGSQVALKLNPPLVVGGDVASAGTITPDGSRLVYRADQETDEVYELFSVPLDGSLSPVKLNGPLLPGNPVAFLAAISPDSGVVVYQAEHDVSGVRELYRVPIDGSANPVKLNGPLGIDGDAFDARFTPDGSRVVYVADADTNDAFELFSVPTDVSQAAVKLNVPLGPQRDVYDYEITPDGKRVIYAADERTNGIHEVFIARVDGSSWGSARVNAALVAGGDVGAFEYTSTGPRVVYLADQDDDEVYELYVSEFPVRQFEGEATRVPPAASHLPQ